MNIVRETQLQTGQKIHANAKAGRAIHVCREFLRSAIMISHPPSRFFTHTVPIATQIAKTIVGIMTGWAFNNEWGLA